MRESVADKEVFVFLVFLPFREVGRVAHGLADFPCDVQQIGLPRQPRGLLPYSCDWFIEGWQNRVVRYKTMSELLAANRGYRTWRGQRGRNAQIDKLLYAEDCDAYFLIRTISRERKIDFSPGLIRIYYLYTCRLQPVNLFGGRIVNDEEDADSEEIEFSNFSKYSSTVQCGSAFAKPGIYHA